MAATRPRPKARTLAPGADRTAATGWIVALLALAGLLIFALSSFILLVVGLLPSLVAVVVDRDRGKPLAISVGAPNVAAAAYFALELTSGSPSMGTAVDLLTNAYTMLAMYGAAGAGWLVYAAMPSLATLYLTKVHESGQRQLRHQQSALIEEWGEEVAKGNP